MTVGTGKATIGRALSVGRGAAITVSAVLLASWLVGVVLWLYHADEVPTVPFEPWSSPAGRAVLAEWGVSLAGWTGYMVLLGLVVVSASVAAAYLVLRGVVSWFRLYLVVTLMLFAIGGGHVPLVIGALYPSFAGAAEWIQGLAWIALFPLAYVYPDGRFVPRWSRWLAVTWAVYLAAAVALDALGTPESTAVEVVDTALVLLLFGTCAGAQIYRYVRVSGPVERQQAKWMVLAIAVWFAFGLTLVVTGLRSLYLTDSPAGLVAFAVIELLTAGILALIPAAIAVAILRYRLFDVNVWISRALIYGVLTTFVVGTYALVVGGLGALWRDGGDRDGGDIALPALATGLVAVAFSPLRVRAQRRINYLVYGRRDDPYALVAELGRRLAAALPPDQIVQTIVATIGTALKFPHVSLTVAGEDAASAVYGTPPPGAPPPATFLLRYRDEEIGELRVTPRPAERLGDRDRELLHEVARQAGIAVRAASLTADLRRSRERIVTAREEERRRLHRDLHDGLGPTLASLYQRVDVARGLMARDPDAARRLLDEVQAQTRRTIGEIRQLVYSLRPPALDEMGLAPAVEEACRQLAPEGAGLSIEVRASGPLPGLPAVVEVAAYRIAIESVTNLVRHARARHCVVHIGYDAASLLVEVSDNGDGMAPGVRAGGGLRSMRERAEEIGGTFTIGRREPSGTVVRATLPLTVSEYDQQG